MKGQKQVINNKKMDKQFTFSVVKSNPPLFITFQVTFIFNSLQLTMLVNSC